MSFNNNGRGHVTPVCRDSADTTSTWKSRAAWYRQAPSGAGPEIDRVGDATRPQLGHDESAWASVSQSGLICHGCRGGRARPTYQMGNAVVRVSGEWRIHTTLPSQQRNQQDSCRNSSTGIGAMGAEVMQRAIRQSHVLPPSFGSWQQAKSLARGELHCGAR